MSLWREDEDVENLLEQIEAIVSMIDIDFGGDPQMPAFMELYLILAKLYFSMWKSNKFPQVLNYMLDVFIKPLSNEEGWKDAGKR